jgi:colanic acid/amylovoran biosynthesis glycosyltransferase
MKIAFFVNHFPVLSETFILNQITGFLDRGHEVDIHTLGNRPKNFDKVHPLVKQYNLIDRTHYPPYIPKNYLVRIVKALGLLLLNIGKGSLSCLPLLNFFKYGQPGYLLRAIYVAMPLLGDGYYDIVHCQFGSVSPMVLLFMNVGMIQGKLITTFRGSDISKYVEEHGLHVYDKLFQTGDFFLSNSDFLRYRAIKLGANEHKIVTHGSGIDCDKFAFNPRSFPLDGQVRIATIGRLVEKKGIEYSIRAIAKIAPLYSNLEYNIIGEGSLKEHFQKLIHELNVSHIVKLLGEKQQQEVINILNNSHIFVAPSVTAADGDVDGPVNTLKEAMAMGLPVIGTWHGGIPELVEDGISGFLVPERNPEAIADKLSYLIDHPEVWSEMGRLGRARVEKKYDMKKLNDELVEIYQRLLNPENHHNLFEKVFVSK